MWQPTVAIVLLLLGLPIATWVRQAVARADHQRWLQMAVETKACRARRMAYLTLELLRQNC
jgi:hypothetical protein